MLNIQYSICEFHPPHPPENVYFPSKLKKEMEICKVYDSFGEHSYVSMWTTLTDAISYTANQLRLKWEERSYEFIFRFHMR